MNVKLTLLQPNEDDFDAMELDTDSNDVGESSGKIAIDFKLLSEEYKTVSCQSRSAKS